MTRFVPVILVMAMVVTARGAHAQGTGSGSLPSGATVVFEKRKIYDPTKPNADDPFFPEPQAGSTELLHYFNLAHCNCAQTSVTAKMSPGNFKYFVHETMPSGSGIQVNIDFWVGSSCTGADIQQRDLSCLKLDSSNSATSSLSNVDAESPYGDDREFNLYQVVNGKLHDTEPCIQNDNVSAPIYAFIRADSATDTNDYDYKTSIAAGTLSTDTGTASGVDTQPPPLPEDLKANPNEGQIDLSWTPPGGGNIDVAYYQALCATVDGMPTHATPTNDPQYVTTASTCPNANPSDIMMAVAAEAPSKTVLNNGEMEISAPTGNFGALNSTYICGQVNSGTASSLSLKHLQNGTAYQVILLAIDLHGNFRATYFDHTITPHLVTDFWEDLHNRDSQAEGGLCLLAETYGDGSGLTNALRAFRDDTLSSSQLGRWLSDAYYATLAKLGVYVHGSIVLRGIVAVLLAPLVAVGLLWHWFSLPGVLGLIAAAWLWRRRRDAVVRWWNYIVSRRWMQFAAGIAITIFCAGRAHAGGYEPYWEDQTANDQENQATADEASLVKWHAGIRVGPYVPDIDKQLGQNPGPYEQMFGGYRILPMLDVDRILWTGFGQVGVGASIGYMQKTARAFATGSDPAPPEPLRDPNAKNTFRLIPFALTATYRFTWFDDNYGVPLVPYVRGGLSYYVWWVKAPNGNFARVCSDGGMEPNCDQNKALGGSLGVQGSIGLAIRAERIDAAAAMSMRNSGIEHAGIYGELSLAKVDGFGSDKKLSVGDRTWFAGVDFEF